MTPANPDSQGHRILPIPVWDHLAINTSNVGKKYKACQPSGSVVPPPLSLSLSGLSPCWQHHCRSLVPLVILQTVPLLRSSILLKYCFAVSLAIEV